MKPRFVMLAAIVPAAAAPAQFWTRQFGTAAYDQPYAVCPAGSGGVFVAGEAHGLLGGTYAGGGDAWIALHDQAGTQSWLRQLGTGGADFAFALAPDAVGGAFVAGTTGGSLGGPTAGGVFDAWLARYDAAGTQLWIRQLGTNADDRALALSQDGTGGVFIAGASGGALAAAGSGVHDAWLARYDAAGDQTWIRQFGSSGEDYARALAPDGMGGVFVGGYTTGGLEGPGFGANDGWLARYDASGSRSWLHQVGTTSQDYLWAMAPDGAGGVFAVGFTNGALAAPNAGAGDIWLARYDAGGSSTWVRQFGTSADEIAYSLAPDGAGGVCAAGRTNGDLGGLNPDPSHSTPDAWFARYDSAGNQIRLSQFGTSNDDFALAVCLDGAGGLFSAGRTYGALGGPPAGSGDIWIGRFGLPCYGNCDDSTAPPILNIQDFACFLNRFASSDPYANCDGSTTPPVLNVQDFACFLNSFAAGCP